MGFSQKRVFEILDKDNDSEWLSRFCRHVLVALIVLSLIAVSLESVSSVNDRFFILFVVLEVISVAVFSSEYVLRIWSAPADTPVDSNSPTRSNAQKRWDYICSFTGIIDLLSILPSFLFLFTGLVDLRWFRVLRLVRLLKFSHYSPALEDLIAAINQERNSFGAAMYLLFIALFCSSALMYIAENDAQPEVFSSIPETMWWSFITLTTVGYGDVVPLTALGKIIGAFTALSGVCVVALLTGIVGTAFANQTASRKEIIVAEISSALHDGDISASELRKIHELQRQLRLPDEYVEAITKSLIKKSGTKSPTKKPTKPPAKKPSAKKPSKKAQPKK